MRRKMPLTLRTEMPVMAELCVAVRSSAKQRTTARNLASEIFEKRKYRFTPAIAIAYRRSDSLCFLSPKAEYALFDLQALELMKILVRNGHRLTFAPNARFMVFDDNYLQMPVVIHRTREALDHTIEAYRELVSKVKE